MVSRSSQSSGFVRLRVEADSVLEGELALADAFEAGAAGAEEVDALTWQLYASDTAAPAVARALAGHARGVRVATPLAVPDVDWSERWKQGLEVVVVSARLRVRPSFVAAPLPPGQAEVVVDPGQAFGTGGHASTRLALEWIDALLPGLPAGARVLDAGCGTGVLALAALRLGAARAVAFDLDPLATEAARRNAAGSGLDLFLGPIEALAATRFELVVANLLRTEMLPLLPQLAAHSAGALVLSGLLAEEAPAVVEACAGLGLRHEAERERADASGERWTALLLRS